MIVLDTHALVWWINGGTALSQRAKRVIEKERKAEDGEIVVSSISAWEIAMLVRKERLLLSMDVESWIGTVSEVPNVRFYPVDNEIAIKSTDLPGDFHKDPADRMIVALARQLSVSLVTSDEKIRNYPHVKTVW